MSQIKRTLMKGTKVEISAAMKPTILIANLTKSELSQALGDSIVSRATENGISIEFNWPSYRKQP